jgi:hypothetical protein
MRRSLYVLKYGCVASKPEAAGWAMDLLGQPGTEFNKLVETLGFIQFSLSCCQRMPVYTIIAPHTKEED